MGQGGCERNVGGRGDVGYEMKTFFVFLGGGPGGGGGGSGWM